MLYKSSFIADYKLREILDSRGQPTIEAEIITEDGFIGRASAPSGASTGSFEALEKRDKDANFYHGKGLKNTILQAEELLEDYLIGQDVTNQENLDLLLNTIDSTENKEHLGANVTLALSMAMAKTGAMSLGLPLYRYLGGIGAHGLPLPLINVLNGGKHADNSLDIQEFMIIPIGASTFKEGLRWATEIYHTLKNVLKENGLSTNVGDEGGFAPNISTAKEALDLLQKAIIESGYKLGEDIVFALDVAANEIYKDKQYHLHGEVLSSQDLINLYIDLLGDYPIYSIEDGLAEDDWEGWQKMTDALGTHIQLVGDDLFVTNTKRLLHGIETGCGNAILIKPNQIGTVSETIKAVQMAQQAGYKAIISHRSGETEDTFIADLSVAVNAGQIKTGAPCRVDRTAKYNQLLRIEEELSRIGSYGHAPR